MPDGRAGPSRARTGGPSIHGRRARGVARARQPRSGPGEIDFPGCPQNAHHAPAGVPGRGAGPRSRPDRLPISRIPRPSFETGNATGAGSHQPSEQRHMTHARPTHPQGPGKHVALPIHGVIGQFVVLLAYLTCYLAGWPPASASVPTRSPSTITLRGALAEPQSTPPRLTSVFSGRRASSMLTTPDSLLAAAAEDAIWLVASRTDATVLGHFIAGVLDGFTLPTALAPNPLCFPLRDSLLCIAASSTRAHNRGTRVLAVSYLLETQVRSSPRVHHSHDPEAFIFDPPGTTAMLDRPSGDVLTSEWDYAVNLYVPPSLQHSPALRARLTRAILAGLAPLELRLRQVLKEYAHPRMLQTADPWAFADTLMAGQ